MRLQPSLSLFAVAFAAVFVLAGCDLLGGSEETVILNSDSPVPPTVEYTFRYSADDVTQDGWVEVSSQGTDGLGSILDENGFSREDIVSAEVERVVLTGLSSPETTQKIYDYVQEAEIYFPSSASAPVAEGQIQTTQGPDQVQLSVVNSDVTSAVKQGGKRALLRLDTQEGGFTQEYGAEAEIEFRIEVGGV